MSYEVIYKTVIVKNDNGEIAVIERVESNNCFPKPTKYDPIKVLYFRNEALFVRQCQEWSGDDYTIKIYGKWKTLADLGKHWLTRYKKAKSYEETEKSPKYSFAKAMSSFTLDGYKLAHSDKVCKTIGEVYDEARALGHNISYNVLRTSHHSGEEFFEALRSGKEVYAYLY